MSITQLRAWLNALEKTLHPYLQRLQTILQPLLAPINRYFHKGTASTALFLLFMLIFTSGFSVPNMVMMIASNFRPAITLSGDDLVDLNPREWQRYTIETDGAVPIGIESWYEQRELGVVTTYRSDKSYWGVYLVNDYYIYFNSKRDDDLMRSPQTLTGRLGQQNQNTMNRIRELIPDLPETVLTIRYEPQSLAGDLNNLTTLVFLNSILLGMAWLFHHQAIKNTGGMVNAPIYKQVMRKLHPLQPIFEAIRKFITALFKLIFSGLRGGFIPASM